MDHYQRLGIDKNATPEQIKKAFRKLAGKHHPDKGGNTATFQQIKAAYDILSDPQLRQEYDNPRPQPNFSDLGGHGFHFSSENFDLNNLHEIFGQVFGQQARSHHRQKQVFRTQVILSLQQAYDGASQILKMQTPTGPKTTVIDIPKGVMSGSQVRYDNIIENGTLLVEFNVLPDLKFERRGHDLYCNHTISVLDLIVGTSFDFTTISGKKLTVNIQPKTQPQAQLKISGQGMPIQNTAMYGDQIILLKPIMPDNIDDAITQSILRSKSN